MDNAECVESIKEVYRLWGAQDPGTLPLLMSIVAEEVQWNGLPDEIEELAFTACYQCKSDLIKYFTALAEAFEMNFYEVDHYIYDGDTRLVVDGRCSFTSRTTGNVFESRKVDIITIEDGEIVEFFEMYDTARFLKSLGRA
ncbi:hypothetical protein AB833_03925 [Chromatiales bacterium (ex Bugula neritina AB1)]|nr:hypothetical protein AB833_03925 [Chromatiales bacterium (ex Bugula neritina AB1)]